MTMSATNLTQTNMKQSYDGRPPLRELRMDQCAACVVQVMISKGSLNEIATGKVREE